MSSISSNRFYEIVGDKTCGEILHPWNMNCSDIWIDIFKGTIQGCFKLCTIIYAMQWLIKGKRFNRKDFKEQMAFFMRSYIYAMSCGVAFIVTFCLNRRLLGKFNYYTVVLVPGFIAGMSIFIEHSTKRKVNTILFFNMLLETAVRILQRDCVLIKSTTVETAFFMLTNAVFMYLLSANQLALKATLIWFFDPRKPKTTTNQTVQGCCEKNQCRKHILQNSLKYFAFGYGFQAMKSFLPRILTVFRKPRQLVSVLFNKKSFLFGSFIGSYVLIYKLVCRELFELKGRNEHNHHLLAGLLAGISYSFKPNIAIAVMPATLILQICWLNIRTIYKLPDWPFTELLFAMCNALLYNARILLPDCCPLYVHNMIHTGTNGVVDPIIKNLMEQVTPSMQNH